MSDSSVSDQPSVVDVNTIHNNNNNNNNNHKNSHQSSASGSDQEKEAGATMHSSHANGRSGHKKSVCPTVTYLNMFPESGDAFKANENGDGGLMKPCRVLSQDTLHTGKYLQLTKYHFVDSLGNERTAEGVHMVKQVVDQKPPRNSNGLIDIPSKLGNLCTIAVLKKQIMCDSLVLTKQYRAPLKAYTIEFPATVSTSIY